MGCRLTWFKIGQIDVAIGGISVSNKDDVNDMLMTIEREKQRIRSDIKTVVLGDVRLLMYKDDDRSPMAVYDEEVDSPEGGWLYNYVQLTKAEILLQTSLLCETKYEPTWEKMYNFDLYADLTYINIG